MAPVPDLLLTHVGGVGGGAMMRGWPLSLALDSLLVPAVDFSTFSLRPRTAQSPALPFPVSSYAVPPWLLGAGGRR